MTTPNRGHPVLDRHGPSLRSRTLPLAIALAFLAIQALFAAWLHGAPARGTGPGDGVALIVILWAAVDAVLLLAYTVYRLTRRL